MKSKLKVFLLLLIPFSWVFFNTAWVAEDAFITFRAVNNLLDGHGPVWNIGERVQVYTHPLWYFLLTIGTAIFKDSYYFSLALSYICLLGVLFVFAKIIGDKYKDVPEINNTTLMKPEMIILPLVALLFSRAFADYSSSGLENPLIHLFLALYVLTFVSQFGLAKKFFITSLLYNLIFITRPDAIFLITPASLYLFYQMVKTKDAWFKLSLLSMLPTFAWELFSIVYYGSFVPNTALAKVNIDYEKMILVKQAYHYFTFNLLHDPLTLGTIFVALVVAVFNKNIVPKLLMLGVVLQLVYITNVGADYMMGRFLSPSILVAVLSLLFIHITKEKLYTMAYSIMIGLCSIVSFKHIMQSQVDYDDKFISPYGIANERGFYYQKLGLVSVLMKYQGDYTKGHHWFRVGEINKDSPNINFYCAIGMVGWSSGNTYWIDPLALSEPFLSRLPAKKFARAGHYERAFPAGYILSRLSNRNELENSVLKQLYDDILLVTQSSDLWSSQRLNAIYRLNSGYYKDLGQYFDRNAIGITELGIPFEANTLHSCMGMINSATISVPKIINSTP